MSYVSRNRWGRRKIKNNGAGKHSDGTKNIYPRQNPSPSWGILRAYPTRSAKRSDSSQREKNRGAEAPEADGHKDNRNHGRKPEAYAPQRNPVEALSHIAFLRSAQSIE